MNLNAKAMHFKWLCLSPSDKGAKANHLGVVLLFQDFSTSKVPPDTGPLCCNRTTFWKWIPQQFTQLSNGTLLIPKQIVRHLHSCCQNTCDKENCKKYFDWTVTLCYRQKFKNVATLDVKWNLDGFYKKHHYVQYPQGNTSDLFHCFKL